jgi:large conductance mechanosensitive channel
MWEEFKKFAMRGNVLDMAVGIIIGAAFGKIITSLVEDILMPPVGLLTGNIDFKQLFLNLSPKAAYATLEEAKKAGAPTLNYGIFVNSILDFILVALAIFLLIKMVNRWKPAPAPPAPDTRECPFCLNAVPLKAIRCGHCTSEIRPA